MAAQCAMPRMRAPPDTCLEGGGAGFRGMFGVHSRLNAGATVAMQVVMIVALN